ncbi:hypothetical protein C8J56DRAFT_1066523 [Mycena floridula]|nr:hypothetical protein C8J56DRAFT_1066523 [Mycena floridula]
MSTVANTEPDMVLLTDGSLVLQALHAKVLATDSNDEDGRKVVNDLVDKIIEVLRKMSLLDPRIDDAIGLARALYNELATPAAFDWDHAMRKLPPIYQGPNARHLGINVQLEGQAAELEAKVQAVEDERVKANLPPFTFAEKELVQRQVIAQFNADIEECIMRAMDHDVQLALHRDQTKNKVLHMAEQIVAQIRNGSTEGEGVENTWATTQVVGYISPDYRLSLLPLLLSIYEVSQPIRIMYDFGAQFYPPLTLSIPPSDEDEEPADLPALIPDVGPN